MNRMPQDPEALLDAAIADVRSDIPADGQIGDAGRRVWARIMANAETGAQQAPLSHAGDTAKEETPVSDHLRSCEDFRALFPRYRAGTLPPARRMLVEDHVHECVACRKALHPVTAKLSPAKIVEMPKPRFRPVRWAIAATILVGAGLSGWYTFEKFTPAPGSTRMTVMAANGPVFKLANDHFEVVQAGATLAENERLRIPGGSTAVVKLFDGSTIEVAERAEFTVSATRRDTSVHLDRGRIIVQAAKRNRGRLYVASPDSRVAVTGTVFSVNRGLKGSRVSVIEGSVEVEYRGRTRGLRPGDQVATDNSMGLVPITDEISWSQNYDQHLALLRQFVDLNQKLQQVQIASLRYGSRLLDAVPDGTTIYLSVPNLGRAIADVERIVKEQAAQSPELRRWLEQQFPQFEKITRQMTHLGQFLGEEIVFGFQAACKGFCGVLIAEVHRPGLREYIQQQAPAELKMHILDAATLNQAAPGSLNVVLANNRVYIGEQPHLLKAAVTGGSRFAQSAFGQTVSNAYRRGTGVLVAADLQAIITQEGTAGAFSSMGIDHVRHLVAEQREINGRTQYSAVVNFDGARRGLASWLANPGPMGSLNYVSPDAQFASSFVVKDPTQMLRDALAFSQSFSKSRVSIEEFERETGVRAQELAAAMGGEVTFALDGPMIPTPAWKLIFEVRDSAAVQRAIEKMVAAAKRELQVSLTKSRLPNGDIEFWSVKLPGGGPVAELTYSFTEGYLVVTPSAGLLERTLANKRSGVTLARSSEFRRRLPRDQQAHFSGMLYQNAGELIRMIAKGAGEAAGASPGRENSVREITQNLEPMLLAIYGEEDRIELASQGSALNLLTQGLAGNFFGLSTREGGHGTKRDLRAYR